MSGSRRSRVMASGLQRARQLQRLVAARRRPRRRSRARAPGRAACGEGARRPRRSAARGRPARASADRRRRGRRAQRALGSIAGRAACVGDEAARRAAPSRLGASASAAAGSVRGRHSVKVLPSPGVLSTRQLAAEQAGDLAADRQAQAGAAVLAAGAALGLLERLEDDAAACPAGMPMPVSATAKAITLAVARRARADRRAAIDADRPAR